METTFNKSDIISLLFYFGYLTIKENINNIGYKFMITNKVIKEVYGSYYLSVLKEYNINTLDDREFDLINEICSEGKIDK